jgi:hypothetical protein
MDSRSHFCHDTLDSTVRRVCCLELSTRISGLADRRRSKLDCQHWTSSHLHNLPLHSEARFMAQFAHVSACVRFRCTWICSVPTAISCAYTQRQHEYSTRILPATNTGTQRCYRSLRSIQAIRREGKQPELGYDVATIQRP